MKNKDFVTVNTLSQFVKDYSLNGKGSGGNC